MLTARHIPYYIALIRLNKPIGILLLLWPTLWAIWLASKGHPSLTVLIIFVTGVIVMRSAGCVINDIADRHYDAHVKRTRERPLASGKIKLSEALGLFSCLMLVAFSLVLLCNRLTIELAFAGAALAVVYPFLKRITHLPQLGLGAAFAWSIPMAFAAQNGEVSMASWLLFAVAVIWPIMYDTQYALADREDDLAIGIKSTAILFGNYDRFFIGLLQALFLALSLLVGITFHLNLFFYASLCLVIGLFVYQQRLIKEAQALRAFSNNHWVGMIIFIGITLSS